MKRSGIQDRRSRSPGFHFVPSGLQKLSLVGYKATDIYARVLKTRRQYGRCLAAVEFTSVSVQSNMNIQQFIHLLIQGSDVK